MICIMVSCHMVISTCNSSCDGFFLTVAKVPTRGQKINRESTVWTAS